jgi:hypothetical protein
VGVSYKKYINIRDIERLLNSFSKLKNSIPKCNCIDGGSTSFRFAGAGNNSVQGGFVGGSLRLHATENLRASVDVNFRGAGGRESEFIGRAGIGYSF